MNDLNTKSTAPRLRTINGAARELKQRDPDTIMGASAIRRLVRRGCIPCVYSGTRAYINFDRLLEYLENPVSPENTQSVEVHEIHHISERVDR